MSSATAAYNLLSSGIWNVAAALPGGVQRQPVGAPEHIPDEKMTFLAGPISGDGFLELANQYHRNCGIVPKQTTSLEQLLAALNDSQQTGAGTIGRLRIVSHANHDNIFLSMFTGGITGISDEVLKEFAESDEAGLRAMIVETAPKTTADKDKEFIVEKDLTAQILPALRGGNPGVLAPFGLSAAGSTITTEKRHLIRRFVDLDAVQNRPLIVATATGEAPATAPQRTACRKAVEIIIATITKPMLGKNLARTDPAQPLTQIHVDDLRDAVFGVLGGAGTELPGSLVTNLTQAVRGIGGGFRQNLTKARARFDKNTVIDIRGCNVGSNNDYLKAVRLFFAPATDAQPKVTASGWYHSYGFGGHQPIVTTNEIETARTNGLPAVSNLPTISADDLTRSLQAWKTLTSFDTHYGFMGSLFTGDALEFVSLRWMHWRKPGGSTGVPPLGLEAKRVEDVVNLQTPKAPQVIGQLAQLVGLPAADIPNTQDLGACEAVRPIAARLQKLGDDVAGNTATIAQLLARCQALAADLNGFTPPTTPANPSSTFVSDYVSSMQTHLTSKLPRSLGTYRTKMADVLGATGELRYFLMSGMPLLAQARDFLEAPIGNYRLVTWGPVADRTNALRSWLKSHWVGTSAQEAKMRTHIDGLTVDWSGDGPAYLTFVSDGKASTDHQEFCPLPAYDDHIKKWP